MEIPKDSLELARLLANDPFHPLLQKYPLEIGRQLMESVFTDRVETAEADRSLLNAHVEGLNSIILFDRHQTRTAESPNGGIIRLFYTDEDGHELNHIYNPATSDCTLRFHDHKYGAVLVPVVGAVLHQLTEQVERPEVRFHKYLFTSAITNGNFGLEPAGEQYLAYPEPETFLPGQTIQLTSKQVHTINTNEFGRRASVAWLVFEGPKEKPSWLFSNDENLRLDASGLYVPADKDNVKRIVEDTLNKAAAG